MIGKQDGYRMFPLLQTKIESNGLFQENKTRHLLKSFAEDKLVNFNYEQKKILLPPSVRSTFLVVFSPDGTRIGSTHGDHKIYITHAKTGKIIRTLDGHPRTPWCLAFHPSLTNILASGCLAGQVRVWDLKSGDCEIWINSHDHLIASLAFHPIDHVILIATYNELHFWDWRQSHKPFLTLTTPSEREKVRFVKFDVSGKKIITGISNIPTLRSHSHQIAHHHPHHHYATSSLLTPRSPDSLNTSSIDFNSINIPHSGTSSPASLAMRRSNILSRVMSMYRQLEGLETRVSSAGEVRSRSTSPNIDLEELNRTFDSSSSAEHFLDRFRNPHHPDSPSLVSPQNNNNNNNNNFSNENAVSAGTTGSRTLSPAASSRIEDARDFAQSVTDRYENSSVDDESGSSTPTQSDESNNLMGTFRKLHALCSRLANLMQIQGDTENRSMNPHHAQNESYLSYDPILVHNQEVSNNIIRGNRVVASTSTRDTDNNSSTTNASVANRSSELQSSSISLTSLLDRLHSALQNMSTAALTTVIAHEHIQQVRQRVAEILERLENVSGYRARLSNLRDQIYEMAEQVSTGSDGDFRQQRLDLVHCLWLVEMCIHLTRRMQRILAADYRMTQITLNSSSPFHSPSFADNNSDSREPMSPGRFTTRDRNGRPPAKRPRLSFFNTAANSSMGSPSYSGTPDSPRNDSDDSDSRPEPIPSTSSGITRSRFEISSYPWLIRSRSIRGGSSPSSPRSSPRSTPSPVSLASSSQTSRSTMFNIPTVRISGPDNSSSIGSDDISDPRTRHRPRSPPLPEIHQSSPFSDRYSIFMPPTPPPNMAPSQHIWFSLSSASAGLSELGVLSGSAINNNYNSRIQCWNFSRFELPDLKDAQANLVVPKCRIHNDASIDISQDGSLLACLVPVESSTSVNLCILSLHPKTFAQCFYVWTFGSNAISVSLSEMSRYVLVGLASTQASQAYFYQNSNESTTIAQVFKLKEKTKSSPPSLQHTRNIDVLRGDEYFSLTSIKWLPNPGEGLIYGTNRGHLLMCRPYAKDSAVESNHSNSNTTNQHRSTTGTQTCSQRAGTLSIGTQTSDALLLVDNSNTLVSHAYSGSDSE